MKPRLLQILNSFITQVELPSTNFTQFSQKFVITNMFLKALAFIQEFLELKHG